MSFSIFGGRARRGSVAAAGVLGLLAAGLAIAAPAGATGTPPPWNGTDPNEAGGLVFYNSAGTPVTGGSTSTPIAAYIQGDHATRTTSGFTDNKSSLDVYRPNASQTPDVWSDFQLMGSAATYPNPSAPGALATSALPVYTSKASDSTLDDVITTFPNDSTTSGYGPNLYEVRVYTAANGHTRSSGYDWAEISVDPNAHTWSLVYSSAAASTTTAPAAPTAVSATAGNASATVHWTAPTDNGGAAITGYQVEYSSNGGTSYTQFGTVASAASTSQTITGLTNGSSYLFKVAAINSVGTGAFSSASSAVTPTAAVNATIPAAPTGVTATAGNTTATVSWTAPTDNGGAAITAYQVQYSADGGTTYFKVGSTTASTSQTVTGLTNGTVYLFRVAAINSAGPSAYSAPSSAVEPLGTPTTLAIGGSSTIGYGGPARLGANLKSNGTALVGATVKLYGEPEGKSTFSYLGSAKTASTGSALLLPKPTATERFYWVFPGDTTHAGSTSSIRTVTVAQGVKVHITAGTLKSSYTEVVYGNIVPTGSGTVDLQIFRNGGWYRLESTTIHRQKMPNGSTYTGYTLKRRIFTKGTYRFRVYKPSTATLRYALSGTITIKVV